MARILARKEGRDSLTLAPRLVKSMMLAFKPQLVVIVGPTASGKSDLGVRLAKRFDGEIVSADSRQVYKGLDIGSGKVTKKQMMGIPHHLLNVASPTRRFTVAQYQRRAVQAIASITRRCKTPFLVGGSPLYAYSVIDGIVIPEVRPDSTLRARLERLNVKQLYEELERLDPRRAKTIESKNPRRLIRALEIVLKTGKPVPPITKNPLPYPVLILGIRLAPRELKKRIRRRLLKRLRRGMVEEVEQLHKSGLSWKRLEELGLEYRFVAQYFEKKISYKEMVDSLEKAINDFARRQMTWFKKDLRIHWIENARMAELLTEKFLISRLSKRKAATPLSSEWPL